MNFSEMMETISQGHLMYRVDAWAEGEDFAIFEEQETGFFLVHDFDDPVASYDDNHMYSFDRDDYEADDWEIYE